MLDGSDIAFANALERAINRVLAGDNDKPGLYQSIRASPNWDTFQRTNGMITAYENVLGEMHKITRYMNAGSDERGAEHRPIN
jgi:hypothetical protein